MSNQGYTLCAVAAGSAYNQMQASLFTAGADDGLPAGYTAFLPLAGGASVAAYNSSTGNADVYAVPAPGQGFAAAASTASLGTGFDVLLPFNLNTGSPATATPMALGYSSASGTVQFFSVSGTTLQAQNTFSPGSGLTTVFPFMDWVGGSPSGTYLLCYDMVNGDVAIYQLTSDGGGGVQAAQVWKPSKPWATGWTRFGVFQFGTENFFIKTNVDYHTVYIDHIMDDASLGTHPAVEHLPLPQDLTAIATFTLQGDPCFATYLAGGGAVTLNRFRGDLTGWNQGAQATAVTGGGTATWLGTSSDGSTATLLFY